MENTAPQHQTPAWHSFREVRAVAIWVSELQPHTVLPWPKLEHQGLTLGEKRPMDHRDNQETSSGTTTAQQFRDGAWETTPGGRGSTWGQVSVVTWDDSQPARLGGLAYIIGDFTDIFAGVFLRHVGEGEDLHVRAVNARTLQPIHKHTCKFKHRAEKRN